jgi:hypothetical protein
MGLDRAESLVPARQRSDPRHSGCGRFLWRGVPDGSTIACGDRCRRHRMHGHRIKKSAMAQVLRDEPVFSAFFVAHLLSRNIRLEEDLVDSCSIRAKKPEAVIAKISQESLAERDRHDALARQLFHEQILQAGVRRLQLRRSQRSQLAAERPPPRLRVSPPRSAQWRKVLARQRPGDRQRPGQPPPGRARAAPVPECAPHRRQWHRTGSGPRGRPEPIKSYY